MKTVHICPRSWGSNCYLLISGGSAIAVDPSPTSESILKTAEEQGAVIVGIILTHCHFDHLLSAEKLHKATGAPVMIHKNDADGLGDSLRNAHKLFFGSERIFPPADKMLSDNEIIDLGDKQISVLHTPGHTPGSICLVCKEILLTGDTLFAEGYGRLDLVGGSLADMRRSLSRLSRLDRSLTVYPGHGPTASLGEALETVSHLL